MTASPEGEKGLRGGGVPSTLSLHAVSYCLSAEKCLVRDLTAHFSAGSLHALLGPNGSGKTTTLRLLAGLLEPTAGEVRLEGASLRRLRRREPRRMATEIAYVPQSFQTTFDFTVYQLVGMGRFAHLGRLAPWRAIDHQRVEAALERMALTGFRHRLARTLSGGELQRAQLARCLASDARILLLDEPTSNLDLAHALEVLEICRDLAGDGRLVLLTLHDVAAAQRFADHVALLDRGRLVNSGPAREVLDEDNIRRVFRVRPTVLESGERTTFWFDRLTPQ